MMLSRLAVYITLLLAAAAAACSRRRSSVDRLCLLVTIASVTHRTGSVLYNNIHATDGQKVPKAIAVALPEQQRRCVVVVVYIDKRQAHVVTTTESRAAVASTTGN